MKSNFSILCLSIFLFAPLNLQANDSNDDYALINSLNKTLKSQLHLKSKPGISHISTFKKNNQIIIKVNYDPLVCYSNLIHSIAQTASRVNGVNFQDSFTLDVVNSYCKNDLFYSIQSEGLNKEVIVQYEDLKGNGVAQHRINKTLCQRKN